MIIAQLSSFMAILTLGLSVASGVAAQPLPGVTANQHTGVVQLTSVDPVDITITLAAGNLQGVDADWWLYATGSNGRFSYDASQGSWVVGRLPSGKASHQGPLVELYGTEVLNQFMLPDGDYKVFFGVDLHRDGIKGLDWRFDTVKINVNTVPVPQQTLEENLFILKTLQNQYLWADRMPDLDPADYASPEAILSHLMFDGLDRWSYITTVESKELWYEKSQYIGIGFSAAYDSDARYRVFEVYRGSPADLYGIKRGDEILQINGKTIEEIERGDLWEDIFGAREVGATGELRILKTKGSEQTVTYTKETVTVDPVPSYSVKTLPGSLEQVGYIMFRSFNLPGAYDLWDAFSTLYSRGVKTLILDLRYNGGGNIAIATFLASLIHSTTAAEEVLQTHLFTKLEHRSDLSEQDTEYHLYHLSRALAVVNLVVLTTGSTCSASELIVNGLRPLIPVRTVGQTSCGKPFGFRGYEFGDEKILYPVAFRTVNAVGAADYVVGIEPDCRVDDDPDFPLGADHDPLLSTAIQLLDQGHCRDDIIGKRASIKRGRPTVRLRGLDAEIGAF